MFDKQLFNKICDAKCSFEELTAFVSKIDEREFDTDNPFEKYYSLSKILSVIDKYQANEINDRFLASWMNAYNWIIMGGFKIENDDPINLKEFLIWQICDWLDSLSFFNWDGEFDLDKYKKSFITLDAIYRRCSDCDAEFAQHGYNDDDVVVLVTDSKSSTYVIIYGELDFMNDKVDIKQVNIKHIKNKIKHLSQIGYTKMNYGLYDNDDFD